MRRIGLIVAMGLASCGGEDGADGESVEVVGIRAGKDCPNGGVRITAGEDVQVVCNGEDGEDGANGRNGADGDDGAQGPAGPQGPVGPQGPSGAAADGGVGWVPQTITSCSVVTSLPNSGVSALLAYQLVRFTDGSVIAICSAHTNGAVGADSSAVYAGWQNGAARGHCQVASDAAGTANGGWWEFDVINGTPRALYHDVGTTDDLSTYTFKTADCPTATKP